nr:putative ribonuclease H-like domain-containing protein [Tanacetum cinerariifolium]
MVKRIQLENEMVASNKGAKKDKPFTSPTANTRKSTKNSNDRRSEGGFGGVAAAVGDEGEESFSDIKTGRIIKRGTERDGLYYVDEVVQSGTRILAHETTEREAWLWNRRLGHPFMKLFFQSKGIVHQTTCPHTPKQNGVAEWKKRLVLEMTKALIIMSHVPKSFWPEALATATYMINRLPTKILKMKTPLETLSEYTTIPQPLTLYPKVFRCIVFAHIPKSYRDKLDPCAEKCVFVGYEYYYSPQHSGQGEEQEEIPSSIEHAIKLEKRKNTMDDEMKTLKKNETWDQWSCFGWPLHQFDVKNAFLHGELKEEVYMEAPLGFSEHFKPGEACRLKKSLYRLKQSLRAWFGRFTLAMKRRSISGYFSLVGGNLVTWRRFPPRGSTQIMCDNKAVIQISENHVQHDKTKHVEVDRHFIKEKLKAGIIELPFVNSSDQLADILTKAVGTDIFHKCLRKLNFGNPTIQLEGWKRK